MKFLAWHLGLGDAIAFADLAVRIADGGPMLVPCYAHNVVSVKSLFVNHPNVELCPAWSGMCEGKLGIACVGGSALMGRVSPSCIPSMRARGGMMETRFDSGSVHNQ